MAARLVLVATCLVASTAVLAAGDAASGPRSLAARSKAAAGGAAWDARRRARATWDVRTGGLTGTAEAFTDLVAGRYADRFELGPLRGAEGFDGARAWSQDASGRVRVEDGGDAREGAASEAYRRSLAFWFPERWKAEVSRPATRSEGGRRFQVVSVLPDRGRRFEMWIDAETMLLDRVVEPTASDVRTTFYSDYREVDGVRVPFAQRTTNGEVRYDETRSLRALSFPAQLDEGTFAVPAPPPRDFAIAGGRSATSVPFQLVNNHIYAEVRIAGRSYHVLCDTGGVNVMSPEVARELGLEPRGALQGRGAGEASVDVGVVRVGSLQIGEATLRDQLFAVLAPPGFAEVAGVRFDGLVGYEVFSRFVVAIDYQRGVLTLTLPEAYVAPASATAVPFVFDQHMPQVDGEVDGVPGKFWIDTGSRGSLDLLPRFVEAHGLRARYAPRVETITGWGVGGPVRGQVTRAGVLRLGAVSIERPVTTLAREAKDPDSRNDYVAGNVGGGVLKRFTVTLDYGHQRLLLEPNALASAPDAYDRSGMWMNLAGDAFEVVEVVPGGPAARAGLARGDRILSLDGRSPPRLSLPDARVMLRTLAAGTEVRLRVRRGAEVREAILVLRDQV